MYIYTRYVCTVYICLYTYMYIYYLKVCNMIHVMYYIKHSAMGDGQFHLTEGKLQAICRYVATEPA
jgi:hypothetical protein